MHHTSHVHTLCGFSRYIYIPLGGKRNVILNTVLVFSFVALWHDLTFRLLAWGWLVSLFVLPELLATYLLPASQVCPLFITSRYSLTLPSFHFPVKLIIAPRQPLFFEPTSLVPSLGIATCVL